MMMSLYNQLLRVVKEENKNTSNKPHDAKNNESVEKESENSAKVVSDNSALYQKSGMSNVQIVSCENVNIRKDNQTKGRKEICESHAHVDVKMCSSKENDLVREMKSEIFFNLLSKIEKDKKAPLALEKTKGKWKCLKSSFLRKRNQPLVFSANGKKEQVSFSKKHQERKSSESKHKIVHGNKPPPRTDKKISSKKTDNKISSLPIKPSIIEMAREHKRYSLLEKGSDGSSGARSSQCSSGTKIDGNKPRWNACSKVASRTRALNNASKRPSRSVIPFTNQLERPKPYNNPAATSSILKSHGGKTKASEKKVVNVQPQKFVKLQPKVTIQNENQNTKPKTPKHQGKISDSIRKINPLSHSYLNNSKRSYVHVTKTVSYLANMQDNEQPKSIVRTNGKDNCSTGVGSSLKNLKSKGRITFKEDPKIKVAIKNREPRRPPTPFHKILKDTDKKVTNTKKCEVGKIPLKVPNAKYPDKKNFKTPFKSLRDTTELKNKSTIKEKRDEKLSISRVLSSETSISDLVQIQKEQLVKADNEKQAEVGNELDSIEQTLTDVKNILLKEQLIKSIFEMESVKSENKQSDVINSKEIMVNAWLNKGVQNKKEVVAETPFCTNKLVMFYEQMKKGESSNRKEETENKKELASNNLNSKSVVSEYKTKSATDLDSQVYEDSEKEKIESNIPECDTILNKDLDDRVSKSIGNLVYLSKGSFNAESVALVNCTRQSNERVDIEVKGIEEESKLDVNKDESMVGGLKADECENEEPLLNKNEITNEADNAENILDLECDKEQTNEEEMLNKNDIIENHDGIESVSKLIKEVSQEETPKDIEGNADEKTTEDSRTQNFIGEAETSEENEMSSLQNGTLSDASFSSDETSSQGVNNLIGYNQLESDEKVESDFSQFLLSKIGQNNVFKGKECKSNEIINKRTEKIPSSRRRKGESSRNLRTNKSSKNVLSKSQKIKQKSSRRRRSTNRGFTMASMEQNTIREQKNIPVEGPEENDEQTKGTDESDKQTLEGSKITNENDDIEVQPVGEAFKEMGDHKEEDDAKPSNCTSPPLPEIDFVDDSEEKIESAETEENAIRLKNNFKLIVEQSNLSVSQSRLFQHPSQSNLSLSQSSKGLNQIWNPEEESDEPITLRFKVENFYKFALPGNSTEDAPVEETRTTINRSFVFDPPSGISIPFTPRNLWDNDETNDDGDESERDRNGFVIKCSHIVSVMLAAAFITALFTSKHTGIVSLGQYIKSLLDFS